MKWKEWTDTTWVLVSSIGEVVDEIKRDDHHFFVLKSSGQKFIDLKSAKNARTTGTNQIPSQSN